MHSRFAIGWLLSCTVAVAQSPQGRAHTHFENAAQWFLEARLIDVTDETELLKGLKTTERSYSDVGTFRDLKQRGELSVRVYAFMPLQTWSSLAKHGIRPGSGDGWLRYGIWKDFTDGSLMFEPYSNNPVNSGNWTFRFPAEAAMAKNIAEADGAGFDIGLHVTGDRAFHALLDWYEAAADKTGVATGAIV